jgi:hypothetical protein
MVSILPLGSLKLRFHVLDGNIYKELCLIEGDSHDHVLSDFHCSCGNPIKEVLDYGTDEVVVIFED